MKRHLHLDLVGGLSGDMFISGMLDAFPEWQIDLDAIIADAGFPSMVQLSREPHDDGTLTGTRFHVTAEEHEGHHHRHYSEIRQTLDDSALSPSVKAIAQDIFRLIAEVEAAIHGKSVEAVAFHEVGAWDSIADVVLAAALIDRAGAESFSISPIPLGRGWVKTAHGRLPVPAPATAKLLEGFEMVDDGIEGERVTPTGAAIIRYLSPGRQIPAGLQMGPQGYGFGSKQFTGLSNTVRISRFEQRDAAVPWEQDSVVRLGFEIDDQTAESLAGALEKLRQIDSVLDVMQQPVAGKKQRQAVSVTVLIRPEAADTVTRFIFENTTTLGVRRERLQRTILPREFVSVEVGTATLGVKVARRPNGYTAKVEHDDLMSAGNTHAEREQVRDEAERLAILAVTQRSEQEEPNS